MRIHDQISDGQRYLQVAHGAIDRAERAAQLLADAALASGDPRIAEAARTALAKVDHLCTAYERAEALVQALDGSTDPDPAASSTIRELTDGLRGIVARQRLPRRDRDRRAVRRWIASHRVRSASSPRHRQQQRPRARGVRRVQRSSGDGDADGEPDPSPAPPAARSAPADRAIFLSGDLLFSTAVRS